MSSSRPPTSGEKTSKRSVVPVDAASLVILRGTGNNVEVLMGRRRPRAAFLPDVYVFPGGRLDKSDNQAPPGMELRREVERKVRRRCLGSPARALALTALRETFEETGLLLCGADGRPNEAPDEPMWRAYGAAGLAPDLGRLDYLARAITPPWSSRRFNTRFFVTRGDDAVGELLTDGELLDLRWVRLADAARRLKIVDVTAFVLAEASIHLSLSRGDCVQRPTILMCYRKNRRCLFHE